MKKILIIGAGFLQTFVIKKAKKLGYYVLAVDGNVNAEGFHFCDEYEPINITDEIACLKYARKKKIDGVMTAATDFGVLTASFIAQELELNGLNLKTAQIIKNKYLVRKKLYENNVDDTEQAFEIDLKTNYKLLSEKIVYPVIVKPSDGSGSRGTCKVTNKYELEDACKKAINNSISHKAEIETFIDGKEYGVECFVYDGKIYVLAIMKKWMTKPPYYAELGHMIPSGLSDDIEIKVKSVIKKAIQVLGINFGSVNMDIIITDKKTIHIIDIGARMGGNLIGSHIVSIGTGIDYLSNSIKAAVGDFINFNSMNKPSVIVTRLLALTPGKILSIPNMDKLEKKYDVKIYHHIKKDELINEYHTNLDGYGYIVAVDNDIKKAIQKADKALESINISIKRK